MTSATWTESLRHLPALRAGAMNGAMFAAIVLAGRFDAPLIPVTVAAVVAVAVAATRLPLGHAVLTGLTVWACLTGFVVNELGQLTFAGPDLARLLLLTMVSVAACAVRLPPRAHSQPTRRNTAYKAAPTTTMSSIANG